jgi:hypothetical protein
VRTGGWTRDAEKLQRSCVHCRVKGALEDWTAPQEIVGWSMDVNMHDGLMGAACVDLHVPPHLAFL